MSIKMEMLRCFRAVVEHGRLSDAAEALGRTSSAVSMMLKQFEDHIGKPLFETTRKARLTALGQQIYNEACRELDHFDRTLINIEGLARAEIGYVRLAVTPSVATVILPPILRSFVENHPKVRVEMRDMNSTGVQRALLNERVDIGIASFGPVAGLEREKLFGDPFGVVCRFDSPLAQHKRALSWEDLNARDFIANGLCQQIKDPEFQQILDDSVMYVPNTSSILALVRAGVGVTLLPKLAVLPDFRDLVFVPLANDVPEREVYLATPPKALLTPAALAFVDAIWANPHGVPADRL
ncbi:LysR family transcriptional regulator [Epibacterium sp. SM1969]|uniref:LysR family transcriptional regulator n=1 Tax=Tritonibacter aquimaris TaxID=2663379 RepID=A0A844AL01_9RHOB|nr:LysR family transcriptional regulator [Tritonibacter aquimaris]MQY42550.1 LysR family transcriptional regulator [Tritonibacter aquimaris]